jgi:hypothetical protein
MTKKRSTKRRKTSLAKSDFPEHVLRLTDEADYLIERMVSAVGVRIVARTEGGRCSG